MAAPGMLRFSVIKSTIALCSVLLFTLFFTTAVYAQSSDSTAVKKDTAHQSFVDLVTSMSRDEAIKSAAKFDEDKITARQQELLDGIIHTTHAAKEYLKTGLDTAGLEEQMKAIEKWHSVVGDGIFVNKGTIQTYRNLETSGKILRELLNRTTTKKNALDLYAKTLFKYKYTIDSLNSDSLLYIFPSDSAELVKYLKKFLPIAKALQPADSAFNKALENVGVLQTHVNTLVNKLNADIELLEGYSRKISDEIFGREFADLNGPIAFSRPFGEILHFSETKGSLALFFYIRNNIGKLILVVLLIIAATFFYKNLRNQLQLQGSLKPDFAGHLVLKYPALSAIMLVLNIFQFIFPDPPFIFNAIFWITSSVCLTIIFRGFITKYWMNIWLTFLVLFFLACLDNLVLQASRTERWIMFGLSLSGVIFGLVVLIRGHRNELREKWILYFIACVVLLEFASLMMNFSGRYNFSKTLLTSGYLNVIIGILFLWTVRLLNEVLAVASGVYKKPDKKLFYINFEKVGGRIPPLFYVLLVIGWIILFGRSFYSFRKLSEPLGNFLLAERTIGEYTFSLKSLLIFISVLVFSAFVSRVVSFFASDSHEPSVSSTGKKKVGLGSWLLLIRITIVSMGVYIAFAAAGIPMDKLAIIVGALGVGVGFGLQTIVNNLVSGLILAFEKPVNVGDLVEISGQMGVMKSMGFRSSVISRSEGADVIIPNGDLLNAHLVNWTISGGRKRVDITVGVAYHTNLEKAMSLLKDILQNEERIMHYPPPSVHVKDFNSSSIDLQLSFWVQHLAEWVAIKSKVIEAVTAAFAENGIEIPYNKQEIYIRKDDNAENEHTDQNTPS
ncbi:mechanosensitive ion channel [Panacibacter sp. DH6]|uniref:Mechanosensitive ion channel n=1 Tax=Panacibacter microcysteis TaxID=2793269 RepID=A0A931E854_9BACT|nr:mechanosensitive ion channel domain-containing protein [Panacibacter microcysteis]MBG9376909.1 mechanosensitive ion channel [Panacibacter microcysteis]